MSNSATRLGSCKTGSPLLKEPFRLSLSEGINDYLWCLLAHLLRCPKLLQLMGFPPLRYSVFIEPWHLGRPCSLFYLLTLCLPLCLPPLPFCALLCTVYYFLSLLWSLLDASGCAPSHFYNQTLPLPMSCSGHVISLYILMPVTLSKGGGFSGD